MREILAVWRDKRSIWRMAISGVIFLLAAAPFRALFNLIPGVTEVRPANVFPVVFGLLWGPAGAWGTAIANACSDILVSRSPLKVWLPGFIINFFYAYLPYKLWYATSGKMEKVLPPSLESVSQIIKYIYVCLLDSLVITTCLGLLFEALGFQAYGDSAVLLFFNNFDFAIVLGVPLILLLTNHKGVGLWEPDPDAAHERVAGLPDRKAVDLWEWATWMLWAVAAAGLGYFGAGAAGILYLHSGADWGLLAAAVVIMFIQIPRPVCQVYQKEERETLAGMSIRAKVIVGFLILSVVFVVVIGGAAYMSLQGDEESFRDVWQNIYTVVGVAINFLFAVSILFLQYVEKNISGPLEALSKAVGQFAGRDHKDVERNRRFIDSFGTVKTGDEIEKLSDSFKGMMTDITDYVENLQAVTKERERIRAELNVATQIQADMLPRIFPPFPDREEFDIFASMNPAKEVGGDFYDFFLIDANHLAVVIADVSGKGVPAALFMVIAKTLIKNHAQFGSDPADIFTITNNQLCEGNEAGLFVTAWLGVLNLKDGQFIYVNAGHNPPLLKHGDGNFEYLKAPAGFVLAGMEDISYTQSEMKLEKGDKLILYTDGVTEAENREREQFGEDRLKEKVSHMPQADAKGLVEGIRRSVAEFADGAEQFDDITMVAFIYRGKGRSGV